MRSLTDGLFSIVDDLDRGGDGPGSVERGQPLAVSFGSGPIRRSCGHRVAPRRCRAGGSRLEASLGFDVDAGGRDFRRGLIRDAFGG